MPLPNFLVIGAGKSGTTSLYSYLDQHPDIFMSPRKEPCFFNPPPESEGRFATRTLEEYLALFDGVRDESAIGEASPQYLANRDAAERIRATIPHARLIAILRNPVERAFSAYRMYLSHGTEPRSFDDAVDDELRGTTGFPSRYVKYGFYGAHLSTYLELFDRAQLRICFSDDLESDPEKLLHDLYGFLGVDISFDPDCSDRRRITAAPPKYPAFHRFLGRRSLRTAKRLVPTGLRGRVSTALRSDDTPTLSPATRARLIEVYRDDIAVVEELSDRERSSWRS